MEAELSLTSHQKMDALWGMLPKTWRGQALTHHPSLGYHAARVSDSTRLRGKPKLADQWVREAVDALTLAGVVSLSDVQRAFGERVKPQQLSLL